MGLIMTQFHFSKQKMESERPKKASRHENKASLISITSTPTFRKKNWKKSKIFSDFYHKRFWCLKRAHSRFKKMNLLMNLTSSGLVAIGAIAGGVTMNPIVLGVISGVGLIVKTASEMKNLKSKIEMSKFAFTTYEKH